MTNRTANKRAKRKERLTQVLGRFFEGKDGREIERAIKDAFSHRPLGRSYRSRRPVEDAELLAF